MKSVAIAYCATLLAFAGIDFVWLSFAGERLYRPVLKDILIDGFEPAPAVAFYLLFAAGLVILAVRPGLDASSLRLAAGNGALMGFFAYATYDLTNQATLRNWTTPLTLADLAWGTALSALAAALGYTAARAFAA
jgi:uncharacterized membrane protein